MGLVVHVVDATIASDLKRFREFASAKKEDVIITLGGMCNGVMQAISDTVHATKDGSIDALIFYGHGAPGVQGVSTGKSGNGVKEGSSIAVSMFSDKSTVASFGMLSRKFSAKGLIVLRGCNTGEGEAGKALIAALSKAAGVPVKASNWFQIVGRSDLAGNIVTATTDGKFHENTFEGMRNLGGLPLGEGFLLLGVELGDRLLKFVSGK